MCTNCPSICANKHSKTFRWSWPENRTLFNHREAPEPVHLLHISHILLTITRLHHVDSLSYQIWYFAESTCPHLQKGEMILFKVTSALVLNEWHLDYIFLFFSICFERTFSLSTPAHCTNQNKCGKMNSYTCHCSFCIVLHWVSHNYTAAACLGLSPSLTTHPSP